ncbi:hypothetical protein HID58_064136 [Brassica napus]|uniref:Uncharacterized protein n=4 Tax=Brassica TaxID=3705 RepID=A0ABQ7Z9K3_BRANA|nr:hypothetical protein HID58_064136 [Brassica napus]
MEPHLATRLSEKVLGLKLQQGLLENQSFFTTKAKHHHGFTHKTWTSKQTKGNADQQQQQLESLTSLASFSDTKDLSIRIQTRMNTTIFEATQMSEGIEEGFTGILLDSDTLGRSFCAEKTKQPARVVGMRATTTYEDNKNYLDNIFIFVDPCRPILSQFSRIRLKKKKMGRRPCCEKMGLKKGPWSAEEDRILISHIRLHGHPNWRALPQLAGLLRCGKSCRLRWINYLRPDIKRGNFTPQEEETIINLHQSLGNRWSAIAAKLPGRTDNEIKNVWHTHLKKRIQHNQDQNISETICDNDEQLVSVMDEKRPSSPQQQSSSSTNISAVTTSSNNNDVSNNNIKDSATSPEDVLPLIDESFWSEVVSMDYNISGDEEIKIEDWESSLDSNIKGYNHDMESWFDNLLTSNLTTGENSDIF